MASESLVAESCQNNNQDDYMKNNNKRDDGRILMDKMIIRILINVMTEYI